MVPGMDHCRGGPGADLLGGAGGDAPIVDPAHDLLSALEAWVDRGAASDTVIASRQEQGRTVRTRLLCAWPARALWQGKGDADTAASYLCRKG